MKRILTLALLLALAAGLWSVKPRIIDENNEFGGVTVKTTYSTGMRYHNEDNVRELIEFFNADSVLVKTQKFMLNGKMCYEAYANGVLREIKWERPEMTIESIERYDANGQIEKIEWLSDDAENPMVVRIEHYTGGVIERIEAPPTDEQTRLIEHYIDGKVTSLDIYDEDDNLLYTHHFDELNRLRRREMFKPDGDIEREFHYDDKEKLVQEVWYQRTGRKTVDHFERGRKTMTEFFDRRGRLMKICYYNNDGVMTRCEKFDNTGAITETETYEVD